MLFGGVGWPGCPGLARRWALLAYSFKSAALPLNADSSLHGQDGVVTSLTPRILPFRHLPAGAFVTTVHLIKTVFQTNTLPEPNRLLRAASIAFVIAATIDAPDPLFRITGVLPSTIAFIRYCLQKEGTEP